MNLGVNFLVVSKPDYEDCEDLLDEIYLLFANYVMKVGVMAFLECRTLSMSWICLSGVPYLKRI